MKKEKTLVALLGRDFPRKHEACIFNPFKRRVIILQTWNCFAESGTASFEPGCHAAQGCYRGYAWRLNQM
jgi:hypothetical protein